MTRKLRSTAAVLAAAAIIGGVLTGCQGGGAAGKPQGDAKTVDYVKKAMEASDKLTPSTYFLTDDGSILSFGDTSWGDFAKDYAPLADKKKLAVSASGMTMFALTASGDLYYRQNKVAEGVRDIVYSTTNVNENGRYIAGDKVYNIDTEDTWEVNASLREANPENYIDVSGGKTVSRYVWNNSFVSTKTADRVLVSGNLTGLGVDKHDFLVLNQAGQVFLNDNSGTISYEGLECFTWDNMALIGSAKFVESGKTLTVAGIQHDGTVKACGDYADEILSWGPLAYLSLSDGMIVGLTQDGKLKMTGQYAVHMAETVESWTNITAVKVGSTAKIEAIVNAVDTDGNLYHLEYDSRWTENVYDKLSPETGRKENTRSWYKYAPDGKVYKTGEAGQWEPVEGK